MPSGGYEADIFNCTLDALVADCGGWSVPVDPKRIIIFGMPDLNSAMPSIYIRFAKDSNKEGWSASSFKRDAMFSVELGLLFQYSPGVASGHPFGDGTTPGFLTLLRDIKNSLETSYQTFFAASQKLLTYDIISSYGQTEAQSVISATIQIDFKARFFAGQR